MQVSLLAPEQQVTDSFPLCVNFDVKLLTYLHNLLSFAVKTCTYLKTTPVSWIWLIL